MTFFVSVFDCVEKNNQKNRKKGSDQPDYPTLYQAIENLDQKTTEIVS